MAKIVLTGGIACGKSLFAKFLRELGVQTLDADDIVHEIIPEAERRRLAPIVFSNPSERKKLEARIHPLVRRRLEDWFANDSAPDSRSAIKVAIIPLLFESHWEEDYDIILCISSSAEQQIRRMVETRGMTREEAVARLNAQLSVDEKAARSHYVISNDSSAEHLREAAVQCLAWLKSQGIR